MLWMIRWAGSFPVFVKEARGAHFTDVDGNDYIDLCLGDTGAMTGHSPDATVKAIEEHLQKYWNGCIVLTQRGICNFTNCHC